MKWTNLARGMLVGIFALSMTVCAHAKAKKNSSITVSKKKKFISLGNKDPQNDKREVNVLDKINGGITAIEYRIRHLAECMRDHTKMAKTEDELKSMAMSIKSEIDNRREDIKQYMMDGEITLNDRDICDSKLEASLSRLAQLRILSTDDLKS